MFLGAFAELKRDVHPYLEETIALIPRCASGADAGDFPAPLATVERMA
jgi:hypothetical protein